MKKEKLLVIGSYPLKGSTHGRRVVGCASYGKDTVMAIKKSQDENIDITVLADISTKKASYSESGINVRRVWKSGSFLAFPNLLKHILIDERDTKKVLFEFEILMFGKIFYLLPLPFFNLGLKLLGKDVTFVCHQVVKDIRDFEGHTNISKESFKSTILNSLISLFYRFLLVTVDKIIVFDEELKNILSKFGDENKIKVIPLAFKPIPIRISRTQARKKLNLANNEFTILCFGFLAWYKGTDWIIKAYEKAKEENKDKKIRLILAGGPATNHKDKEFYKNYISWINKEVEKENIILTGFVPEKDIQVYYQASDLVVFPYRLQMSASGPLSLAYSFKKPTLVSNRLEKIFLTKDINKIITEEKINLSDLIFKMNYSDFSAKIGRIMNEPEYLKKLTLISEKVSSERSWEKIGLAHFDFIFSEKEQRKFIPNLKLKFSRS